MARIPRILITGDPTAYHVISRTALPGYPLEDIEKDYFVELVKRVTPLYFVELLGFCVMGNHFHLLVRMLPDTDFSNADILKRIASYYGDERVVSEGQLPHYRSKLGSLSEFILHTGINVFLKSIYRQTIMGWKPMPPLLCEFQNFNYGLAQYIEGNRDGQANYA